MTEAEVLDVVQQAASTVLDVGPGEVAPTARLRKDLRADRLALLEIVEIVQTRLAPTAPAGFRIEDEDLAGLVTVGDVVDCVLQRAAP
jgi:acyl carrier protein